MGLTEKVAKYYRSKKEQVLSNVRNDEESITDRLLFDTVATLYAGRLFRKQQEALVEKYDLPDKNIFTRRQAILGSLTDTAFWFSIAWLADGMNGDANLATEVVQAVHYASSGLPILKNFGRYTFSAETGKAVGDPSLLSLPAEFVATYGDDVVIGLKLARENFKEKLSSIANLQYTSNVSTGLKMKADGLKESVREYSLLNYMSGHNS